MSKKYVILILVSLAVIFGIFKWIQQPNADLKKLHQSILCHTLTKSETAPTEAHLLSEDVERNFSNLMPMNAYKKPKFDSAYAEKLIDAYFKMTPVEQKQAQHDYQQCLMLFKAY